MLLVGRAGFLPTSMKLKTAVQIVPFFVCEACIRGTYQLISHMEAWLPCQDMYNMYPKNIVHWNCEYDWSILFMIYVDRGAVASTWPGLFLLTLGWPQLLRVQHRLFLYNNIYLVQHIYLVLFGLSCSSPFTRLLGSSRAHGKWF